MIQQGPGCSRLGSGAGRRVLGSARYTGHVRHQVSLQSSAPLRAVPSNLLWGLVQSSESSHRDSWHTLRESLSDSREAQTPPRLISPNPLLPTSLPFSSCHQRGAPEFPLVPNLLATA